MFALYASFPENEEGNVSRPQSRATFSHLPPHDYLHSLFGAKRERSREGGRAGREPFKQKNAKECVGPNSRKPRREREGKGRAGGFGNRLGWNTKEKEGWKEGRSEGGKEATSADSE